MAAPMKSLKLPKLCDLLTKNLTFLRNCQSSPVQRTITSCQSHQQNKWMRYERLSCSYVPRRNSGFLNTLTSDQLWAGVIATTGKQQKKARGKKPAKKTKKNLNKGQMLGDGQYGISWPGLNTPMAVGKQVMNIQKRQVDPELEEKKRIIREQWDKKRPRRVPIDQRGWTSASFGGRSLGPPDPKPGETFNGFESCVIQVRRVFNMVGSIGRKRSMSALVVVGNRNGSVGFAFGKAPDAMSALRKAKNKAANNLQYIERYEDHTILHDFESKFHKTRVRLRKQNKGHGLRCHRIILEVCKLAGIKDLEARVLGPMNPIHITQALFAGFGNQESFQAIADRKGLNVVEFRAECGSFPIVKASPDPQLARTDVPEEEWDKSMPLEWKEEQPPRDQVTKKSHFRRPGVVIF